MELEPSKASSHSRPRLLGWRKERWWESLGSEFSVESEAQGSLLGRSRAHIGDTASRERGHVSHPHQDSQLSEPSSYELARRFGYQRAECCQVALKAKDVVRIGLHQSLSH